MEVQIMPRTQSQTPQRNQDGYYRESFWYNGKKYTVRSKTMRGLYEKVAERRRALESGEIVCNQNTLVKSWAEEWLVTYKKNSCGAAQYETYSGLIRNHIVPAIGSLRLKDVKPIHCQRILNNQTATSKSHLTRLRYTIKQIFTVAHDQGLIPTNPAANLVLPKATEGSHRAITDEERRQILLLAETHPAGLWVKVMLYCGLRPGETAALRWRHVDLENGVIHVEEAVTAKVGTIGPPKSQSGVRTVPIPAPLLEALSAAKGNPDEFLFVMPRTGRHHTKHSLRSYWKNFKRALDIQMGAKVYRNQIVESKVAEDLTPYCLRHTYCTDLQAAGVPINVARELMGHSSIELTARIYTHSSQTALQRAASAINQFHENYLLMKQP